MSAKRRRQRGFTLVELLVVMGILTVLLALMAPALSGARRQARSLINMSNQQQIVQAVTCRASDHGDHLQPSSATVGMRGAYWNWLEPPTMITYWEPVPLHEHRSISGFLYHYIDKAAVMYCPNMPHKYHYADEAWQAGDRWDNPKTTRRYDPHFGSYSFYWGYRGYLPATGEVFYGPTRLGRRRGQSSLLISDTLAYDSWHTQDTMGPGTYISCERFLAGDGMRDRKAVSVDYWYAMAGDVDVDRLSISLQGGFEDGRVERYGASDVTTLQVSSAADGSVPRQEGYGDFAIPNTALRP